MFEVPGTCTVVDFQYVYIYNTPPSGHVFMKYSHPPDRNKMPPIPPLAQFLEQPSGNLIDYAKNTAYIKVLGLLNQIS